MKISSIPSARRVVQHCKWAGIRHIVISPGSRNAPLTLGFTGDPYFRCYSLVDERCAAFFALGLAQQLRHGVAVVCTSGSALLNFYPAIAEAFYSLIPLLVISADRPPYKVDIGDGQTIRQDRVFMDHIGYTARLKQDVTHAPEAIRQAGRDIPEDPGDLEELQKDILAYNDQELTAALSTLLDNKLPVHINVPLEEPLYQTLEDPGQELPAEISKQASPGHLPDMNSMGKTWAGARRKMVLIGAANPDTIAREWLDALAGDPSVLVFTETTSNIHHEGFISNIDSILWPIERTADPGQKFAALKPDLLVTLGGMVVSKKIKAFLRRHRPARHWHVDPLRANDTYFSLTDHLRVNPNRFFEALAPFMQPTQSPYRDLWVAQRNLHRKKRDEYLQTIPFSDMLAFHHLLGHIPEGYQVQLANSSTVRYTQLFDLPPSLRVFCNRGTSGIDGSTSTAVGASLAAEAPTLLLTGDLSFLYDSNGLWNRYIRPDFRIIVINNGGGGIFRILPGQEESETYETFFETTQDLDLQGLARVYGFSHSKAENEDELLASMADFYTSSRKPKILEIRTPRLLNNKILLTYFDFLS